MSKFKVGDKVRIVHTPSSIQKNYNGEIGIVLSKRSGNTLNLKINTLCDNDWWYFGEHDVELLDESITHKKLKVGDKVRIKSKEWFDAQPKDSSGDVLIHSKSGWIFFNKMMSEICGRLVTISTILHNGRFRISDNNDPWQWTEEMFDLDEPTSTPFLKIATQMKHIVESISGSCNPRIKDLPLIKPNKLLTHIKLD